MKFRVILSAIGLFCAAFYTLDAQNKTVTGKVVSEEGGEPVIGAGVFQEGTANGAVTGMDGTYKIEVPENSNLVFSYIGYETQTVEVNGRSVINVTLKVDSWQLEQATVVGYGTGTKVGTLIGSVTKVEKEKLENLPAGNIADVLQGKVAGLSVMTSSGEPSAQSSIRLHGVGSLSAGTSPLLVLNGVPVSESVYTSIHPNDIESFNVLKDASATSIYGSRAANGVIFITTKKGRRDTAPTVIARAQYGISQPATGKYEVLSGAEAAKYQLDNGLISISQYKEIIDSGINTNWRKYYYKQAAPTYQADLSVSGGGNTVSYYVSGSFMSKDGTAPGSSLERYSFNANADVYARKWLKIGANLIVSFDKRATAQTQSNSVFNAAFMSLLSLPYESPYNEDNTEKTKISGYYNPNYMIKTHPKTGKNLAVNGNAYIQITPVKNLNFKSQLGVDSFAYWGEAVASPSYEGSLGNGTVSRVHQNGGTFTITNTLDYNFDFKNPDHKLYLLAGQEGIRSDNLSFSAQRGGQINDALFMISTGSGTPSVSDSKSRYVFNSWFGRLEYGYSDRYVFDASVRRDASSRFGKKHRSGVFYSFGFLWNIKRESFLRDSRAVNDLSLKVSYGTQGNADISNYAHMSHISTSMYGDEVALYNASAGNENLGWETQGKFTVAAQARFADRVTVEAEFYNRHTKDLLIDIPVSAVTGYITRPSNVGSMVNRGVDLSVDIDIFRNRDWYVGFNASFNYNRNKITKLFNGLDEYVLSQTATKWTIGHDMSELYLQKFVGVNPDTGAPMWEKIDSETGKVSVTEDYNEATLQMTGKKYIAPYTGGFGLSAAWKGISLTADFSWQAEKYLINNAFVFLENTAYAQIFNSSKRVLRRWRNPGDVTDMPKFGYDTRFDTSLLENASFLRLKNLTLAYEFPKPLIRKSGFIDGFRIYVVGRNLFTVTGYSGYDPEVDTNFALGDYPNTREIVAGVQFTF